MHARELSELASWAAFTSQKMISAEAISGDRPQIISATNKYWTYAKCRQQRWMTVLKLFELDLDEEVHNPLPAMEIVIQEVFLSTVLARVWSATLMAHDNHHNTDELTGVAHSIHVSQVEIKNRCMRLLLRDDLKGDPIVHRSNQLRKKIERWTDMLLGQIPDVEAATTFAFEPNRVKDFIRENEHSDEDSEARQSLYTAALSKDLRETTSSYSANPALNRKIAAGILACFPADRFGGVGLPESAQSLWMENTSEDTQSLVDGLFELDSRPVEMFEKH